MVTTPAEMGSNTGSGWPSAKEWTGTTVPSNNPAPNAAAVTFGAVWNWRENMRAAHPIRRAPSAGVRAAGNRENRRQAGSRPATREWSDNPVGPRSQDRGQVITLHSLTEIPSRSARHDGQK